MNIIVFMYQKFHIDLGDNLLIRVFFGTYRTPPLISKLSGLDKKLDAPLNFTPHFFFCNSPQLFNSPCT